MGKRISELPAAVAGTIGDSPIVQSGITRKVSKGWGFWTPTASGLVNISASVMFEWHYDVRGPIVLFGGRITAQATAASAETSMLLDIPVVSDFLAAGDAVGTGVVIANTPEAGGIFADAPGNKLALRWYSNTTANRAWSWHGSYRIR